MKTLVLALILGYAGQAKAATLLCEVIDAGESVLERKIDVAIGAKTALGEHRDFRFEVSAFEESRFEIEVLDMNVPARTYAQGRLLGGKDLLKWSLWSRYASLDVTCRLANP